MLCERGVRLAIGAEQHLRIVLAGHLREDVGGRLDRFAARGLGRGDDLGGERVLRALGRKGEDFGQPPAVAGFGQDPQALGEEQPFLAPRLLVAQRAQPFDRGVRKSGDLAGHSFLAEALFDQGRELFERLLGVDPSQWMMTVSPIAAPSIIRPMIEVPHTRLPSFSTSIWASSSLAMVTNFALARA